MGEFFGSSRLARMKANHRGILSLGGGAYRQPLDDKTQAARSLQRYWKAHSLAACFPRATLSSRHVN